MSSLRVLWLIRGLGPGGAEHLLLAHARAGAADIDYEVAYQVEAKDHLVPALEEAGVVVHRLPTGPRWPLALRALAADRHIDVVHAHSPAMAVGARLALRAVPGNSHVGLVYTEHNRWAAYRRPTRWSNAATFALDDRTFAVSAEAARSVAKPLRSRVETLHHGIDIADLRRRAQDPGQVRHALGVADADLVVAHVANFRREKAHEVLLDALVLLRPRIAPRVWLIGHGQRFEEVASLVTRLGLDDQVALLGFRDDVPALIGAADALVLSSDHEGLPVAVMEALGLGTPIVSTRVGGIPEAITDGVEGVLVAPRAPRELADALESVLGDDERRAAMGAAALQRSEAFEAKAAARHIEIAYRDLVARRAR